MNILRVPGTDKQLYPLVGPLVMDSKVLKQNLNFPFRTGEHFRWFVAVDDEGGVLGFIPVECKRKECVINNYFVWDRTADTLRLLLDDVVAEHGADSDLTAVSFLQDVDLFKQAGFREEKVWTNYIKLRREAARHG